MPHLLLKEKKATLDEAIKLIKKKIQKKEVHFSNISCDLKTIDKVIEISEKRDFLSIIQTKTKSIIFICLSKNLGDLLFL